MGAKKPNWIPNFGRYIGNGLIQQRKIARKGAPEHYAVTDAQYNSSLPHPLQGVGRNALSAYIHRTNRRNEAQRHTAENDRRGCFIVWRYTRDTMWDLLCLREATMRPTDEIRTQDPFSEASHTKTHFEAGTASHGSALNEVSKECQSEEAAVEPCEPALASAHKSSEASGHKYTGDDLEVDFQTEESKLRERLAKLGKWILLVRYRGRDGERVVRVPDVWLRDHCQCDMCINQDTRQREVQSYDPHVLNSKVEKLSGLDPTSDALGVKWSDGHKSCYSKDWVVDAFHQHSSRERHPKNERFGHQPWSGTWQSKAKHNADHELPRVNYQLFDSRDEGMQPLMEQLSSFGLCIVTDCPTKQLDIENRHVVDPNPTKDLLEQIGPIRNTHYGGFYDFTADLSSKDTAYTSQHLPPHNDTTYFSEPSRLQAFHLLSHTDGEGGETQLVDGFRVAKELSARERQVLRAVQLHAHSSGNENVSIVGEKFSVLDYDDSEMIKCVRWNNDDRCRFAPEAMRSGADLIEEWYSAAQRWNELVNTQHPEWWIEFKLQPGMLLIFDNWRVLHGRSSFTGKRRMCGAYISHDDYMSRWKHSAVGRAQVLQSGIY